MDFNGDCHNKTDEELVRLTLQQADWYGCLMQRYEHKLSRYIKRISGCPPEDVEDLLQEIFLAVYRNLNDFNPKLKFSSWIYRIAHNKTINQYRKAKARAQVIDGEEGEKILQIIHDGNDLSETVNDRITGEVLQRLFQKIEAKYKEVLVLKYLEEKDYQEMSDILKKPIGTIGTLLSRAKKSMLEIIKQEGIQL